MELWIGGETDWIKKPFKSFSESEPLFVVLVEHQKEDFETEHWMVFSVEEEEELKKIAKLLFPANMIPLYFLEVICRLLWNSFSNPPYVTYVQNDWATPPEVKNRPKSRLAIRFNHDFSGQ